MINAMMAVDWTAFFIKSIWWIIPLCLGLWLTWKVERHER